VTGNRSRRNNATQDPDQSSGFDFREWYHGTKNNLIKGLLLAALVVSVAGQFIPPFGDFLGEHAKFGVVGVIVAISFILLDAVTNPGSNNGQKDRSPGMIIRRPSELRQYFRDAFQDAQHKVTIDFFGFTGETLYMLINEFLHEVQEGKIAADKIKIRILIPDPREPWVLPCNVRTLDDNPVYRAAMQGIVEDKAERIVEEITRLNGLSTSTDYYAEIKVVPFPPLIKLYIINEATVFWGYYPIEQRRLTKAENGGVPTSDEVYDLRGTKTFMLGTRADGTRDIARYHVYVSNQWFSRLWDSVAALYSKSS
jgi:hypothetical protein